MEWVDKKSGKSQIIKAMHTYPSHSTSTQKTEMDLCSGSKDLKFPSIMHMTLAHGTLLFCGKPIIFPIFPQDNWNIRVLNKLN